MIQIPLLKAKLNIAECLQLNSSNIKHFLQIGFDVKGICKIDIESHFTKQNRVNSTKDISLYL